MTNQDPWKNRSRHMKCQSCMAFAPKNGYVGRCRRHAPSMSGYPVVFAEDDWCLDHKLDEEYVKKEVEDYVSVTVPDDWEPRKFSFPEVQHRQCDCKKNKTHRAWQPYMQPEDPDVKLGN